MEKSRVRELLAQVKGMQDEIEADIKDKPRTDLQAERLSMVTAWLVHAASSLMAAARDDCQ